MSPTKRQREEDRRVSADLRRQQVRYQEMLDSRDAAFETFKHRDRTLRAIAKEILDDENRVDRVREYATKLDDLCECVLVSDLPGPEQKAIEDTIKARLDAVFSGSD